MPTLISRKASVSASAPGPSIGRADRIRLPYLDGLRGFTALYVVLHHLWQMFDFNPALRPAAHWFGAFAILKFGHTAVGIFIVLSGYCLMLPCLREPNTALAGGLRSFFVRRARRIVPPYYAALILTVILLLVVSARKLSSDSYWTSNAQHLTAANVLTHLFLAHNLFRSWITAINPPFWSIALEWQIYFVFAFLLLPLWRRWGAAATVLSAFAIGCLPVAFGMLYASPWYVGLFALGMGAAHVNFGASPGCRKMEARSSWLAVLASCVLVGVFSFLVRGNENSLMRIPQDVSIGFGIFFLLIECTKSTRDAKSRSAALTILNHPIANFLGRMSYSLYLVHYPILALLLIALSHAHLSNSAAFLAAFLLLVPICVGLAYLFYLRCERPFLTNSAKA